MLDVMKQYRIISSASGIIALALIDDSIHDLKSFDIPSIQWNRKDRAH